MPKIDEIAICVNNIHKEFVLPQNKNSTFKQTVVNIVKKNNKVTQKVLDGVSFDVHKGDFFGIVGRNGSGKSTLLKLIAGVYTPTAGDIQVYGGLTPFIELGVGFNPELSGRDNVYLNGALLGFNRKQMDVMYDEIVDFAELEQFMDQKLKNYSSGMQVRLAFSIAIKAKNDILIFDEVLAVGDEAFQRKCLDVFEKYKAEGQTVILVTHAMDTVRQFCNRAVLINNGKIMKIGNPKEVADEYASINQLVIDKNSDTKECIKNDDSNIKVKIIDENGKKRRSYGVNEKISFDVSWDKTIPAEVIMLDLYKNSGEHVSNFISSREGVKNLIKHNSIKLSILANLAPGAYYIDVGLWDDDMKEKISASYNIGDFTITKDWSRTSHPFGGITLIDHNWN